MSGYEEIASWAFELFDPSNFEDYEDWVDTVKENFIQNGRDLDNIFDSNDFENLEEAFNEAKFGQGVPPELEREEFTSQAIPEIEKTRRCRANTIIKRRATSSAK